MNASSGPDPRPSPGRPRRIAYFSMEIGLAPRMQTYAGGLGVLAGDTVRAAADLGVPMAAVTLLHRKGYFRQRIDEHGRQHEAPDEWPVAEFLTEVPQRTSVTIEGRTVRLRCWRYDVAGAGGATVPVYLLDSDVPENSEWDRTLTDSLYGDGAHYRLCQEAVLGIGGVRMLRELGHTRIGRFHMNEGHAALLALELLEDAARAAGRTVPDRGDVAAVREQCVFTTHTPVPAGHDQFPMDLVRRVLGERPVFALQDVFCCEGALNMTYLALNLSHYINGVARSHAEVSKHLFAGYKIDAITNGVHAATWVSESFQDLFDRWIPAWREDNFSLRSALAIPAGELRTAHLREKARLIRHVREATGVELDENALTLGFARRATAYKRGDLLFADLDRLRRIAAQAGPLQVVFAGKAHPRDELGRQIIERIVRAGRRLGRDVPVVYLADYGIDLAKRLVAGCDVWLNTPQPPLEASGTSGMKAALNGVPSLSVLDGWWIEGHIEDVTGWSIGGNGRSAPASGDWSDDAASLYDKLEHRVLPLFHRDHDCFLDIMRHAIALNGSFFNTQRMMQQYVVNAYFR